MRKLKDENSKSKEISTKEHELCEYLNKALSTHKKLKDEVSTLEDNLA